MKYEDSDAMGAKWGRIVASFFNGWDIVGVEDTGSDVHVLATQGDRYRFAYWECGSCRHCDKYEDMTPEKAKEELAKCVVTFGSKEEILQWVQAMYNGVNWYTAMYVNIWLTGGEIKTQ